MDLGSPHEFKAEFEGSSIRTGPPLEFNVPKTYDRFLRGYQTVSWTKLNQFEMCPAQWFVRNFFVFANPKPRALNHTRYVAGLLIQRVMQEFINERIYAFSDITYEGILEWFQAHIKGLYKAVVFDLEDQKNAMYSKAYFKCKGGKERLQEISESTGSKVFLMKGLEPLFVERRSLWYGCGSEEAYLEKLTSLVDPILKMFLKYEMDLNRMLSEVSCEADCHEDMRVSGKVDFLYNRTQGVPVFTGIKDLNHGYVLLDGKMNVNQYVTPEQMQFYGALLYYKYKKIPVSVGFIEWSTARMKAFPFEGTYVEVLRHKVCSIGIFGADIKEQLLSKHVDKEKTWSLDQLKLYYTPGDVACLECPIANACGYSKQIRKRFRMQIVNKQEVKAYIEALDLTEDPVREITL